jgi:hypothetical protein
MFNSQIIVFFINSNEFQSVVIQREDIHTSFLIKICVFTLNEINQITKYLFVKTGITLAISTLFDYKRLKPNL